MLKLTKKYEERGYVLNIRYIKVWINDKQCRIAELCNIKEKVKLNEVNNRSRTVADRKKCKNLRKLWVLDSYTNAEKEKERKRKKRDGEYERKKKRGVREW